ncbi:MAG: chromate transporter [Eubacteriales bacterium]|nr:chromate transporter [Eubacteriales bacterium]
MLGEMTLGVLVLECLKLLYVFFKIGVVGFGGGYAMISMIMTESLKFGITLPQLADLNALDMVVPGPIAINAATYVGYLHAGFWGALAATIGISVPSLIIVTLVMQSIERYRHNQIMAGFLTGVKPAAVGLIVAASMTIASGILFRDGAHFLTVLANPLTTISWFATAVFVIAAVLNIRYKVSPILLTLLAGIAGALLSIF